MINNNKKALTNESQNQFSNMIINGKTYTVNELGCIFDYNVLMLIDDKKTLLDYYYMAVETGIKRFKNIVDSVIERKFYR